MSTSVNYNSFTKILTIETTNPQSFEDITVTIPAQKLILRHYRVDLNIDVRGTGALEYRRVINLEMGSVVGTTYVIDDDAGFNYFKIGLSRDSVWNHPALPDTVPPTAAYTCQTTTRDCHIPLTMNGPLDKNFSLRVRGNDHLVFSDTEFKYMLLQFECTGDF